MSPTSSAADPRPRRRSRLWILPLVGVAVWKLPYAAVLGLGLIPSGVTWLIDRDKAKLTTFTVAALNAATLTPVLLQVWEEGGTMGAALKLMSNPLTWVLILAGVMAGWFFAQVVPRLVVQVIMARERGQAHRMKERQKQLVEEWGSAIAEGTSDAPSPSSTPRPARTSSKPSS